MLPGQDCTAETMCGLYISEHSCSAALMSGAEYYVRQTALTALVKQYKQKHCLSM